MHVVACSSARQAAQPVAQRATFPGVPPLAPAVQLCAAHRHPDRLAAGMEHPASQRAGAAHGQHCSAAGVPVAALAGAGLLPALAPLHRHRGAHPVLHVAAAAPAERCARRVCDVPAVARCLCCIPILARPFANARPHPTLLQASRVRSTSCHSLEFGARCAICCAASGCAGRMPFQPLATLGCLQAAWFAC